MGFENTERQRTVWPLSELKKRELYTLEEEAWLTRSGRNLPEV